MNWFKKRWIDIGRKEMLREVIEKFQDAYDQYYGQGEFDAANLVTDMVAYLQDDKDGISDESLR